MKQVQLPPGCRILRLEDGTRYVAPREGGMVTVSDDHARAIDRMPGNGDAGLVHGNAGVIVKGGPRNGRKCLSCGRLWYPWTLECCGEATVPESVLAAAERS